MTAMSLFPTPTYVPMNDTLEVVPFANGTRLDCAVYFEAPVLTNFSTNTTSLSCSDASKAYNVSLTDFISWNPSLNAASCRMTPNSQYCGQRLSLSAPNMTSSCVQYEVAQPGWACQNFTASYGIEQDVFGQWNPTVGDSCQNFQTGKFSYSFISPYSLFWKYI
jgi:hypothetical protein